MPFTETAGAVLSSTNKDAGFLKFPEYEMWPAIDRVVQTVATQFAHVVWREYLTASPLALLKTTSIGGDAILLKSFPILQGAETNVAVESSATDQCDGVSLDQIRKFRASAHHNKKRIVYALGGTYLFIARGSGLPNYGTSFVLRFPKRPDKITSEISIVQLPEGFLINVASVMIRKVLITRYANKPVDVSQELGSLVRQFYASRQFSAAEEEIKKKTEALT